MLEPRTEGRREPSVLKLDDRVRALEERAIADDALHANLVRADSQTANSVDKLTTAIADPRAGLIVELDRFRREVAADRDAFRSWVKGATAILSIVFGTITILSPWIRDIIAGTFGVVVPPH